MPLESISLQWSCIYGKRPLIFIFFSIHFLPIISLPEWHWWTWSPCLSRDRGHRPLNHPVLRCRLLPLGMDDVVGVCCSLCGPMQEGQWQELLLSSLHSPSFLFLPHVFPRECRDGGSPILGVPSRGRRGRGLPATMVHGGLVSLPWHGEGGLTMVRWPPIGDWWRVRLG
jgi:hypothetical protein